jgi:hypothetical protein
MKKSPSWETNSNLASQDIPSLLWKPKVHVSLPLVPTLSLMNPVQNFPSYFPKFKFKVVPVIREAPRNEDVLLG